MNIFEQATRMRIRFETSVGHISVEDLWSLPLTNQHSKANLDEIAIGLDRALKDAGTTSFVKPSTTSNARLQLSFDIVKHIIDVKVAERDAAETRQANADKKQRLLSILESKELEALSSKSVDELRAEINALG